MLAGLAGVAAGIGCLASEPPLKPGSYPGLWGLDSDHLAVYRFNSLKDGAWSGEIDLASGTGDPPVSFVLDPQPPGGWTMTWESSTYGGGRTTPLLEVSTPYGKALIGSFEVSSAWGLVLIHLNQDPASNPGVLEGRIPELVEAENAHFRMWTSEDGLASNATRVGLQTSDGFIWIGTTSGLSRFDGHEWVNYGAESNPPLSETYVSSMAEDAQGILVLGTNGSGILRFDGTAFTPVEANERFTGLRIQSLQVGPDGSLWFDDQQRVFRLRPDGTVTTYSLDSLGLPRFGWKGSRQGLSAPVPLEDGRISVQSSTGMYLLDPDGDRRLHLCFGWYNGQFLLCSDQSYWSCFWAYAAHYDAQDRLLAEAELPGPLAGRCLDRNDHVWVAERKGLFRWDSEVLWRYPMIGRELESDIVGIFPDREGHIWVLSYSGGVGRLRPYPVDYLKPGADLTGGSPGTLLHDQAGRLQAAIGVAFVREAAADWEKVELGQEFRKRHPELLGMRTGFPFNHQSLMVSDEDPEDVWYGIAPQDAQRRQARYLGFSDPLPILARSRAGEVTFFGCDALPDGVRWVQSIAWTRDQGVWAATDAGILHLQDGELVSWNDGQDLPRFPAICAYRDRADTVWLGGYDESGLYRVNGDTVTRLTAHADGLASDNVLCAYEDAASTLWVGGLPGLTRIQGDRIEAVASNHELFRRAIHAIIEDQAGNLWFGTPNGIFCTGINDIECFLRGEIDELPVIRLGAGDGLHTDTVVTDYMPVASRSPTGRLCFSMVDGLATFDPAEVLASVSGPPVRITSVLGADETFLDAERAGPQPECGDLVLPPAAGDLLRVRYTALDFAFPERDRFRYRLRGVSEEWADVADQRQAWFSGLAPGRYTFEVEAHNRNGAASPTVASLNFTVLPHYYETWTFRVGVIAFVVLLATALHRARVRAFRHIEQLEKQVAMDNERSRIARDMHDEIGSSLGQIRLLGELADKFESHHADSEGLARQIANLAQASSQSLRQIIWSLNPNRSSYDDLLDYLPAVAGDFFADTPIELTVRAPRLASPVKFSPAFKRDLILMLKGIMSNVLQHAAATQFHLDLALTETELALTASDNGRGFDPTQISEASFGLQSLRERVEGRRGRLRIDATPGKGTRIEIKLPLP